MDDLERFIRYHVASDDVVLDIGANQGHYAKLFASLAREVYCLEPNPDVFAVLEKNVCGPNVKLIQMAASDRLAAIDFYLDKRPDLGGVASSINVLNELHAENMAEKVTVQATTVDHLCESRGIAPSFIKVDVEGHEPKLFEGARKTLKKYRPVLVFEFWETWWDNGFSELFTELESLYHLIRVQDGANASHIYRAGGGDDTVDIAAIPRRNVSTTRRLDVGTLFRSWTPWRAGRRAAARA